MATSSLRVKSDAKVKPSLRPIDLLDQFNSTYHQLEALVSLLGQASEDEHDQAFCLLHPIWIQFEKIYRELNQDVIGWQNTKPLHDQLRFIIGHGEKEAVENAMAAIEKKIHGGE